MDDQRLEIARAMGRRIISDVAFNDILRDVADWAYGQAEDSKELTPYLYLVHLKPSPEAPHPLTIAAVLGAFDENTKYDYYRSMGQRTAMEADQMIAAFFMVAEFWLGTKPGTEPRLDPDREECILVSGMTLDKRTNAAFFKVQRNKDEFMRLEPPVFTLFGQAGSQDRISGNSLLEAFVFGYAGVITSGGGGFKRNSP